MKGRLRIRDRTDEREIELTREDANVGSSASGHIAVGRDVATQSGLSLQWEPRHATWVLHVALALSTPATVNARPVNPGEAIPLSNLDTIELPNALIQFQRVLAPPMRVGPSRIARSSRFSTARDWSWRAAKTRRTFASRSRSGGKHHLSLTRRHRMRWRRIFHPRHQPHRDGTEWQSARARAACLRRSLPHRRLHV